MASCEQFTSFERRQGCQVLSVEAQRCDRLCICGDPVETCMRGKQHSAIGRIDDEFVNMPTLIGLEGPSHPFIGDLVLDRLPDRDFGDDDDKQSDCRDNPEDRNKPRARSTGSPTSRAAEKRWDQTLLACPTLPFATPAAMLEQGLG
jgi:hypothetical protein